VLNCAETVLFYSVSERLASFLSALVPSQIVSHWS